MISQIVFPCCLARTSAIALQLAGVVRLEKDDHLIRVQQAKSPATLVERDNVRLQGKQDRGMPLVIAVMDDVVTGAELLE